MFAAQSARGVRVSAHNPARIINGSRRTYARPVNARSSIDVVLGIAPPSAPLPMSEEEMQATFARRDTPSSGQEKTTAKTSSEETPESSLREWLKNTGRPNNPNDLSDLLKGNRPKRKQQVNGNSQPKSPTKITEAIGAMRRGKGSAIPTQDIDNPLEDVAPHSSSQTVEVVIEEQESSASTPVDREHPHAVDALYGRNDLDERILAAARALHHSRQQHTSPGKDASSLGQLLERFHANSERTLSIELPNESMPKQDRQVPLTSALSGEQELHSSQEDGVLLIAYITGLQSGRGQERITLCSGFAVDGGDRLAKGEGSGKGALVVSCAHTLRGALPKSAHGDTSKENSSIALAVTRSGHVVPIKTLLSSLPMSDLVLLQLGEEAIVVEQDTVIGTPLRSSPVAIRTLPVNPYPAPVGAELCVSSFWGWEDDAGSTLPAFEFIESASSGSSPDGINSSSGSHQLVPTSHGPNLMISPSAVAPPLGRERDQVKRERDDAGRSRWGRARLVEYRDWSGQEAQTGTYDELAQFDFKLLHDNMHNPPALQSQSRQRGGTPQFPPPGSSGGPIVDASTGAVVGVTRGTKMSQLQGKRGDGVPAERLFFMFALPGFAKKPKD